MRRFKKIITNREVLLVILIAFLAVFFSKFPTLYHWLNTPQSYWYPKQTSWFDAWDINTYISYMRYAEREGVMLQNLYTTISHPKVFIFQFYSLLGIINRFLHLDYFVLFHLSSVIFTILLVLVSYAVVAAFFKNKQIRISSFISVVLGGGFGWLPIAKQAADRIIAGFTFVNAFERGHDAASTLFLLLQPLSIYLYLKNKNLLYLLLALLCAMIGIVFHPPLVIFYLILFLATGIWEIALARKIYIILSSAIFLIYFFIYYFYVLINILQNPAFTGLGDTPYTNSFSIILGLGIFSFFICWQLIFSHNSSFEYKFIKLVNLIYLFLITLPVKFTLYYVKGWHVWLIILAFYGISEYFANKNILGRVLTIIVFISVLTRIYMFTLLISPNTDNSFFFLTRQEGEALQFMSTLPKDKNILSLYRIGNYIPAHTDNRVYYGHKYITPKSDLLLKNANDFYTVMDKNKQTDFLEKNKIDYVYFGFEEQLIRRQLNLEEDSPLKYLPVAYQDNDIKIYQVNK